MAGIHRIARLEPSPEDVLEPHPLDELTVVPSGRQLVAGRQDGRWMRLLQRLVGQLIQSPKRPMSTLCFFGPSGNQLAGHISL